MCLYCRELCQLYPSGSSWDNSKEPDLLKFGHSKVHLKWKDRGKFTQELAGNPPKHEQPKEVVNVQN